MTEWIPSDYIEFSARRGDEDLHVQVIGGMEHPSGNPQLMAVVLEVRLGPDCADGHDLEPLTGPGILNVGACCRCGVIQRMEPGPWSYQGPMDPTAPSRTT